MILTVGVLKSIKLHIIPNSTDGERPQSPDHSNKNTPKKPAKKHQKTIIFISNPTSKNLEQNLFISPIQWNLKAVEGVIFCSNLNFKGICAKLFSFS